MVRNLYRGTEGWTENSFDEGMVWPKEEDFKEQNRRAINMDTGKALKGNVSVKEVRRRGKKHESNPSI